MTAKCIQTRTSPARAYVAPCRVLFAAMLAFALSVTLGACSNSDCAWDDTCGEFDYLPLDDTKYPYVGIPRIVIKTDDGSDVSSQIIEIPAKLQVWGATEPESGVMELTIRGRGNTSWETMPKKSYKIEFAEKQAILGMPEDRDWALVSNFADKSLMKNFLAYQLAADLGMRYAPRCRFVELYLNRDYLGVYLLTETIKVAEHRVNIPKTNDSYLVEITQHPDSTDKTFVVHAPKDTSEQVQQTLREHTDKFDEFLETIEMYEKSDLADWLDIEECTKHYWVQEFAKNPDATGVASLYFTWVKGSKIRMGPVWDFDLAFGGHSDDSIINPDDWYIRRGYWHSFIFRDLTASRSRVYYWRNNKEKFAHVLDAIDSLQAQLQGAAENNFKKWKILKNTEYEYHRQAYGSYEEAVDDLKKWTRKRYEWIDGEMSVSKRAY